MTDQPMPADEKVVFIDQDDQRRYDAMGDTLRAAYRHVGSIVNRATGQGGRADKSTYGAPARAQWLSGGQISALMTTSWLVHRGVTLLPEACVSRGLDLFFKGEGVESDVKAELEDHAVMQKLGRGHAMGREHGGSAVFILADDGESVVGEDGSKVVDHSRPLRDDEGNPKKIERLFGFHVLQGGPEGEIRPSDTAPDWAVKDSTGNVDLFDWRPGAGEGFAQPIWWKWTQRSIWQGNDESKLKSHDDILIHRDRLIFFGGAFTDNETKRSRGGWDLSFVDLGFPPVRNLESAWSSLVNILAEFVITTYKIKDYRSLATAPRGFSKLIARLSADAVARSILHANVCDAEDEDVIKTSTSIAGVNEAIEQLKDAAAGNFGIPRSIYFSESPAAGGKDEAAQSAWQSAVSTAHELHYIQPVRFIVELLNNARSRPARERTFLVSFPPLRKPSSKEEAEAWRTIVHGDEIAIKNGIITREESRGRNEGPGLSLNLKLKGGLPDLKEAMEIAKAGKPGFDRESGNNTEAQGKVGST